MSQTFTGRHLLLIMISAFGIIIAVNVAMAFFANNSWSGFVVRNSYVAGLDMNRRLKESQAQAALGWTESLKAAEGALRLAITDAKGEPVRLYGGTASFRRPASDLEDAVMPLAPSGNGALAASLPEHDGAWIVEIEADAGRDAPWRATRRLYLKDGESR